MSDPKLISPLLDNYIIGGPVSDHHGIKCCPAMENNTDERYIVKVISLPATPSKIDALLLTGAFSDKESAVEYFKGLADDILSEVSVLERLSELEGFLPYTGYQMEPMDSASGYDIYLLSPYKRSLTKHFKRHIMTHLDALNLGLDLCAALGICRRSGYLYVDLKPNNVFVTGERLYRIGDIGFIPLDSLKYASLPDKYLSEYTPPEINDAFSSLNTTMDTYAAGLILYQAYNNGALPFNADTKPGDILPPPLYADYEMSEIILKACSPKQEDRWQDPMQMGQAIINYMQRNGALDTPIVPAVNNVHDTEPETSETNSAETLPDEAPEEIVENTSIVTRGSDAAATLAETDEEPQEEIPSSEPSDTAAFREDEYGNLSLWDDITTDDTELIADPDNYESLSDEVCEILTQADELVSLTVPDPVVVPDAVEVPIPEISVPEETPDSSPEDSGENAEESEADNVSVDQENIEQDIENDSYAEIPSDKKKKRHWLRNIIIILILAALLAGGYYYYQNFYLLPIDSIILNGTEDSLTVKVNTQIDESLLQVICSDTYGNQIPAPVINGIAEFTNLVPDTAYSINVISTGFHRIIGNTATAYSTPVQSNIIQFDAVTGGSDGSVILSFTVEGPDCEEWTIQYSAEGEENRTATFSSHIVTLTDLTIGKEYTFQLIPEQDLYLTGQTEVVFTASNLIKAENLTIESCMDNALTVCWNAPENKDISGWTVRCFNDTFSETIITTDTFVTFQNIDHNAGFSVEVKAIGMSVGEMVSIPENSVTVSNFQVDSSDPTTLSFTWETSRVIPDSPDGWRFCYRVEGTDEITKFTCIENSALIKPIVPNATYHIWLEDKNGNILLGSPAEITTGDSVPFYWDFDGYDVHTDDLNFYMCKTPDVEYWTRFDLDSSDYTTTFTSGEKASFLVYIAKRYNASSEQVSTMYVIRNSDGLPLYIEITSDTWLNMWYKNYCELDIPVMPTIPGEYTIEVFFNGGLVVTQPFTISQ